MVYALLLNQVVIVILALYLINRYWRLFSRIETLTDRIRTAEIEINVQASLAEDYYFNRTNKRKEKRDTRNDLNPIELKDLKDKINKIAGVKIGGTD